MHTLEIKTFGLGSRIGDVEVGGLKNDNFLLWGCSSNLSGTARGFFEGLLNKILQAFFGLHGVFLASSSQRSMLIGYEFLNKFSKIKFSIGCMVWPWLSYDHVRTFVKYWWDSHFTNRPMGKGVCSSKGFFYSIFLTYFFSEDKIENNANSICIHNCSRHHTSSVERFSELSIQTFSNTSL